MIMELSCCTPHGLKSETIWITNVIFGSNICLVHFTLAGLLIFPICFCVIFVEGCDDSNDQVVLSPGPGPVHRVPKHTRASLVPLWK